MAFDVELAALLLFAPLRRHFLKESGIHQSVELVHIHSVNAFIEASTFSLQTLDRRFMFLAFICMAGVKGFADPVQHLVIKPKATEHFSELLFQHFFAHVLAPAGRGVALTLIRIAGAVIVNVLLLLDLTHNRASTFGTGDQAREGEIVLRAF